MKTRLSAVSRIGKELVVVALTCVSIGIAGCGAPPVASPVASFKSLIEELEVDEDMIPGTQSLDVLSSDSLLYPYIGKQEYDSVWLIENNDERTPYVYKQTVRCEYIYKGDLAKWELIDAYYTIKGIEIIHDPLKLLNDRNKHFGERHKMPSKP